VVAAAVAVRRGGGGGGALRRVLMAAATVGRLRGLPLLLAAAGPKLWKKSSDESWLERPDMLVVLVGRRSSRRTSCQAQEQARRVRESYVLPVERRKDNNNNTSNAIAASATCNDCFGFRSLFLRSSSLHFLLEP
jgi:hypothetical protein